MVSYKPFLSVLLGLILSAFLGYFIAPDNTVHSNRMDISLALLPIGQKAQYIELSNPEVKEKALWQTLCFGKPITHERIYVETAHLENNRMHFIRFGMDKNEKETIPLTKLHSHTIKSQTFWLGTDKMGRDFLSRMILGSRISIAVGFVAVTISLLVGIPLGAIAGYYGGLADAIISWLINVLWSIPTLLLVIAITLALGKGVLQIFIAIGLSMWVEVARLVRGQFLSFKHTEYVQAAQTLGFGNFYIMFREILPNMLTSLIIVATANFSSAVLIESGLSFLGFGAQPPVPSWGGIIKDHYPQMVVGLPHLAIIPGISIMFLVINFYILGSKFKHF